MTPDSPLNAAARARVKAAIEATLKDETPEGWHDSEEWPRALHAVAERLGIDL